jgi:kumamolisin
MAELPAGYVRVEGSERRPVPGARLLGPADRDEAFRVTIVLRRRADGPAMPNLEDYARIPPGQRLRLSEAEFAARYGASSADIDAVRAFASANGLTVHELNAARRSIVVSGTVPQMEAAFAVSLGRYGFGAGSEMDSGTGTAGKAPAPMAYRGREGFVHIPESLADAVVGVFGLDNRRIGGRNSMGDPPGNPPASLIDVLAFYDFPKTSADNQTIAIVSAGGSNSGYDTTPGTSNNFATFFGVNGLSTPTIITAPHQAAASNGTPDNETTQDICIAGAVAQGATIAVYFLDYFDPNNGPETQQAWTGLLGRIVAPDPGDFPPGVNRPSVISCSLYISDGDDNDAMMARGVTYAFINAVHMIFEDAVMNFITVCVASGDQGTDSKLGSAAGIAAWYPGRDLTPDHKAHVQYPATDPLVLSCGGTAIGNVSGPSFDEYVWNDTTDSPPAQVPNWATGGGVSDYFTEAAGTAPGYQQAAGLSPQSVNDDHVGRGVPDVAGNASLNTGYQIWVGQPNQTAGQPISQMTGGTSAVAPLYAGLVAVLNAALGDNIGFLNPTLYALESYGLYGSGQTVCRAIVAPPGPTNNGLNGITGYTAGPGWDACTGWGVIQGNTLLPALQMLYRKSLTFIARPEIGKNLATASLSENPPGPVYGFHVVLDGFSAADLTPGVAPAFTSSVGGLTVTATGLLAGDLSLPGPQQFTWVCAAYFDTGLSAFTGVTASHPVWVLLRASISGLSAYAWTALVLDEHPGPPVTG